MNRNAKIIRELFNRGEHKIRLHISTSSGPRTLPSATGFLVPEAVPGHLVGRAQMDTFDLEGRPARQGIEVQLPGQPTSEEPSRPADQKPTLRPISEELESLMAKLRPATPSPAAPAGAPPPTPPRNQPEQPDLPPVEVEPDLAREVTLAQTHQLRSWTAQSEAASDSAIEQERMGLVLNSTYTREVAEWQQLSSITRAELYKDAARTQEFATRSLEQADFASRQILRNTTKAVRTMDLVAKRLKSRAYQPPPAPKPQVDYGAIAIEGMRMFATFAQSMSPNAFRPQHPQLPPHPVPNEQTKPKTDDGVISLSKDRLLELADAKVLGIFGNSEAFAALARADRLHTKLTGVEPPENGVYSFRKSTLLELARDGTVTLFGDSAKLIELLNSDQFEQFLGMQQKDQS